MAVFTAALAEVAFMPPAAGAAAVGVAAVGVALVGGVVVGAAAAGDGADRQPWALAWAYALPVLPPGALAGARVGAGDRVGAMLVGAVARAGNKSGPVGAGAWCL